jgi:hypothetical protein
MRKLLSESGRYCAICALWLLVIVCLVLSVPFRWLSLPGLTAAEWLQDRIDDLS